MAWKVAAKHSCYRNKKLVRTSEVLLPETYRTKARAELRAKEIVEALLSHKEPYFFRSARVPGNRNEVVKHLIGNDPVHGASSLNTYYHYRAVKLTRKQLREIKEQTECQKNLFS